MNSYRTRRATVDDLAQLAALWQAANLPVAELEKRFTDFQVAEDEQGKLAAAIGLHIEGGHGRVHSESFADFALADALRPALWKRLQVVAQNHGLFRLWTEAAAPFWKEDAGFSAPPDELLKKLPEPYGPRHPAWLTLRLRDEGAEAALLDKEIAFFREVERARREKIMHRGKVLKIIGAVISVLLLLFALTVLFSAFKHRR
jgi:N-acetylglutamate synthase-like GNAT family acetyltransferase